MTLAATLVSSFLSVLAPQGGLQLPPRDQKPARPAAAVRPVSELEQFRRDLGELNGPEPKVEAKLQEMAQTYPALEPLIVEVARKANSREMGNLVVIARRVGGARIADELLFQLLARPLGEATRDVLETLIELKGADARKALQDCVRARIGTVRRTATELYARQLTADDLHFALQITTEPNLDLQLAGVTLLAALPDDRARQRLIDLLPKDAPLAAAACLALIAQRTAAVPALQQAAAEPAIDRAFGFLVFALAQIEDATGQRALTEELVPKLLAQLRAVDPAVRALVAVPLADLAFRSEDVDPQRYRDREVVAALLDVVAPTAFVGNLDLLRKPCEERLLRLTGRSAVGEVLPWREWWTAQQAEFAGMRARVRVDAGNAAFAVLTLRNDRGTTRLLGEGLADLPPIAGAREMLLTKEQMLALVQSLREQGFLDPDGERPVAGLPLVRHLQLQVQGARAQASAPASAMAAFDRQLALVDDVVRTETWQVFRHPTNEPDRAAFWRSERRWLDANPDPIARNRRVLRRVLDNWSVLSEGLRGLALEQLAANPERRQIVGEAEGAQLVAIVRNTPEFSAQVGMLLDLACLAPGDQVWRDCVAVAVAAGDASRQAVHRVFKVLGPDRVLAALADSRPEVRRAAIDQVATIRDPRSGPLLVALIDDPDPNVALAAVFACGQVGVAEARTRLIELISGDGTLPELRRGCLRALGRVGGDGAFAVLQRALAAPDQADKEAALRGLGELREPRAAAELAGLFVMTTGTPTGDLARFYLQRLGAALALPALQQELQLTRNAQARAQLVLLLGGYQDPEVIPDLIELLRSGIEPVQVCSLLSGTIGVDVAAANDRVAFVEEWLRAHRNEAQWQWLLQGLQAANSDTSLKPEMFQPGAGLQPVPELARILVEAKEPRLRVLASAVLRAVTGQDHGPVSSVTPIDVLEGIAARYRIFFESSKAAQGR